MARDPDIWGEDCCEYKPSRWIDEDGSLRRFSNYKFHAFKFVPFSSLGSVIDRILISGHEIVVERDYVSE